CLTPATPSGRGGVPRAGAVRPEWPAVPGYEVLGELGRGGMGVVYQARQTKLNRVAALKVIRPGDAAEDELARLRTESGAPARPQHPNVIQVFEVGEWLGPGGPPQPYVALEYVDGGTLRARLAGGVPQPPAEAAALVEALARAVHHAHEHGVVHRDL